MHSKLTSAREAVSRFVKPGMHIAFGGFSLCRNAMNISHEIIRQKIGGLHVSSVNPAEVGPPYTSIVIQPQVTEQKESTWGAHVGVDVGYTLLETATARIGVGGFMRYAGGSTDIEVLNNGVKTSPGGFQIGGGLRIRF